jgi:hypothetical protein
VALRGAAAGQVGARHAGRAGADPAERALYEQLKLMHQADATLVAPAAIAWAKQYETSWDADNGLVLDYFRKNA